MSGSHRRDLAYRQAGRSGEENGTHNRDCPGLTDAERRRVGTVPSSPIDSGLSLSRNVDISDLIGKEFEYGAQGPERYDCYNLCREILRRRGSLLPEFESTDDRSLIHQSIYKGREFFTELERPEPYCIVVFEIRPPYATHMGVVLYPPRFIHVMRKRFVVIERLDSVEWRWRIRGFYIPIEVTPPRSDITPPSPPLNLRGGREGLRGGKGEL